jgi:DNA ligase D-like protein (predicted 3'-phosphoesterase)
VVASPRFVVQLHDATTLHFDFRLQSGDVLRSWAVPKGPSLDPGVRRLAVPVDDHSLAAGEFEGVHDGQRRGTGAVIIWDEGTADILRDEPGHVSFILHGRKLSGGFALTRTGQKRWILVKVRDEDARPGSDIVAEQPASVRSGKTWEQLRDGEQIGSPGGKPPRLCADAVTLGSSPMSVNYREIPVMTADIFAENVRTESNRMGIDGETRRDAERVRLVLPI